MTSALAKGLSLLARQALASRGQGEIAQLVEHTTENRGVPGSIPGLATFRIACTWPLTSDRAAWLEQWRPECGASPGSRCQRWHSGRRGSASGTVPVTDLHVARGWLERSCPTCRAGTGERCLTPSGREALRVHRGRLRAARWELLPFRHRRHPGRLASAPHALELPQTRNRWDDRIRTGRHHHVPRRVPDTRDFDHAGAGEPATAPQYVDTVVGEPALLAGVGVARDHEVPPRERCPHVDLALAPTSSAPCAASPGRGSDFDGMHAQ